ncbi:MAG: hypothetical protein ACR2P8_03830 [Myxococcota bacterium]
MKRIVTCIALWFALATPSAWAESGADVWASYLDYAYVYSSAEPQALQERLAQYGKEAGIEFDAYLREQRIKPLDETDVAGIRRHAIALLLDYLSRGEPTSLDASVDTIRMLEERLGRHENRYWYRYILSHRALEKGRRFDFVGEVLDLWLEVVVPLESPHEALQILSLSESPNSGFVSALPYIYENVARLVLLRSQKMNVDRDLDPLGGLVLLMGDNRIGANPDVIPPAASSKGYVDRIVARLKGPESDAGSLTFTLALFEATKEHERARGLLATEGFTPEALDALRASNGAYQTALDRAVTEQGRCAVYTRVLRQLGEVYAAKQRLGENPEIDTPFSLEGAIEVYAALHKALPDGWAKMGYVREGPTAMVEAMHGLWEEVQETTLNASDSYLAQALAEPHRADEHARNAARLLARYLAFFDRYARNERKEGVPDSAYFAAHESARGVGDAFLAYAARPSAKEVELATRRYRNALELFPFDRTLWPALTAALERQGRETEFLGLARPVAEWVTRSRSVDAWIEQGEPGAREIATLRRALSDTQVRRYLGFGEAEGLEALEQGLAELRDRRVQVDGELKDLIRKRDDRSYASVPASQDSSGPEVASAAGDLDAAERAELHRRIDELTELMERLDKQIAARSRALPLYKETRGAEGLLPEMRVQRDHVLHTLLRRMFHERLSRDAAAASVKRD